jgi:hypothetical protein
LNANFVIFWFGLLPTMKLQLSQLLKIVGLGRVATRPALFSYPFFLIPPLKRLP